MDMRMSFAVRNVVAGWLALLVLAFAAPAHAEQRVALVIANSTYAAPSLGRLPGTRADAALMKTALEAAGFKVRSVSDLDRNAMRRAIADFTRDLTQAGKDGVGFLYYSGHGIADARRGQNYLIPIDADVQTESDLPLYGQPMDEVLDAVEAAGAKAAFVVFDACRSTPTSLSRGGKGLQPARARTDTLIAYATAPGETAADDGLYARVLAAELKSTGSESDTLFQRVQRKVAASTGRRQVPEFVSRLAGDSVQFVVGPQVPAPIIQIAPAIRPTVAPVDPYARWGLTARNLSLLGARKILETAGARERLGEITQAATAGDAVSQTLVGLAYDYGIGTEQNSGEALRWYRQAAERGEPVAMRSIGVSYDNGDGVPKDYAEAMRWYRRAADLGEAVAMKNIGYLYDFGQGVPKDYDEAMRWYRKAADLGWPDAMTNIGFLYANGHGVPQSSAEAMKWYRKAADLGEAVAMKNIGYYYDFGRGVPQDYAEAMRWYRKAADLGVSGAMTNIGALYANAQGVTRDYAEAMRWYRKGADRGDPMAMKNLGTLYANAQGVPLDYVEARRWYEKAAALGNELAKQELERLKASGH